jgi:alpha-L-fucosidase
MAAAAALGTSEICLTAAHEGGFALWPSKATPYSVAASSWRGGKGDVLREFVDSANKWGIKICYYLNVQCTHYSTRVEGLGPEAFIEREVGMLTEVLTSYGPVNRFWFDGTIDLPKGTNETALWARVYDTIRTLSPPTLISAYRGDVCATTGSLLTRAGPSPNSSDLSLCAAPAEGGGAFQPSEMHGITAQMGPDGNTDDVPTYWFWHPWACAGNVSGCPWVGHTNASRIFDSYIQTVGHGAVLNFNCPAERTGRMNASLAAAMAEAGAALNATFRAPPLAALAPASTPCGAPLVLELPGGGGQPFDYVVTMEDLRFGQRVANYSFDYQAVGSDAWEVLVPPVWANKTPPASPVGDRPDGHDPRDQYIGRKRIDVPVAATGNGTVRVARVRFNCLRAMEDPVYLKSVELRARQVPWEPATWRGE